MKKRKHISGYWERLFLKLKHWEFWPTWIVYLPVLFCFPFWALRSGSIFFFSTVNPNMKMGGLYGASKFEALIQLAQKDYPKTRLFKPNTPITIVKNELAIASLSYPLIVKPDLGERGKGVQKVMDETEMERAITGQMSDFLVQEYLNLPFEAGVFYIRRPSEQNGKITSIVVKDFLTVIGDGERTVQELALANKRSVMIWKQLKKALPLPADHILNKGESLLLEPIGNHSRGTAFLDGNHLVTVKLGEAIELIAQSMPDFYYGRFDLRTDSIESFQQGINLRVMEVNGANAEAAHIYQEGSSLWTAIKTLVQYWQTLYEIAKENQKTHRLPSIAEAHDVYRNWQNIKKERWSPKQEQLGPVNIDTLT